MPGLVCTLVVIIYHSGPRSGAHVSQSVSGATLWISSAVVSVFACCPLPSRPGGRSFPRVEWHHCTHVLLLSTRSIGSRLLGKSDTSRLRVDPAFAPYVSCSGSPYLPETIPFIIKHWQFFSTAAQIHKPTDIHGCSRTFMNYLIVRYKENGFDGGCGGSLANRVRGGLVHVYGSEVHAYRIGLFLPSLCDSSSINLTRPSASETNPNLKTKPVVMESPKNSTITVRTLQ